jgi:hypothetical protein
VSRDTRAALVDTGGRFMTSRQMTAAAQRLGMQAGGLYFRGRVGPLGALSAPAAVATIAIFPAWVVELTWAQSADLPDSVAVDAYVAACGAWGDAHLSGLPGADRLATLAEAVVDEADPSALPLFAAWKAQPRPAGGPARTACALMVLRELRGGLHFAALRCHGLPVPAAVLADPGGGLSRLRRTAWRDDEILALQAYAAATPDLERRWVAAEEDTTAAFARQLAVLSAADLGELQLLLTSAEAASR